MLRIKVNLFKLLRTNDKSYIFAPMKFVFKIFFVVLTVISLTGCADYQKILKGDDYEVKFLEANRQYESGNYGKAIALYEQIYQRFPRTDQGKVSYFRIANSYYKENDYVMAGYYFNQFSIRYPTDPKTEEATFMMAMCSVHNSPSYTLDQSETVLALNDLQVFVQRYPQSEYVDSCNNIMDRLRFKIETKSFEAVKLYDKTENYRAAVTSSKAFLEEYPQSSYIEEVTLLEFENAHKLAMLSILSIQKERIEDALDIYGRYKSYFQTKRSVANYTTRMYEELQKELAVVEEKYSYNAIVEAYQQSNSTSQQKKVRFLKETIVRFNTFAKKHPNSSLMNKAENIHKRAERELENINK
ncbi:MAG: outer membrane protein assembly factor BamD [Brumimicrobium sp.]